MSMKPTSKSKVVLLARFRMLDAAKAGLESALQAATPERERLAGLKAKALAFIEGRPALARGTGSIHPAIRTSRVLGKLCITSRGSRSSPHRRCDKASERSACLIGRSSSATQSRRL